MMIARWIALVTLLAVFTACEEEKETRLSDDQRRQVTQLYADSVRRLTPIVDSLCVKNQSKRVAQLADSLFAVRRADFEARTTDLRDEE